MNADQHSAGSGWIDALGRYYNRAVIILACTIMLVIVAVMGTQVFFRYVLNDSLIWAEAVCGLLLALMTFLLVGAAFQRGQMITLRVVMGLLPPKIRIVLMIPIFLAMIVFLAVLGYYSVQFANVSTKYTIPAVEFIGSAIFGPDVRLTLSMYWLYMAIPVACLLLTGHFLVVLLALVRAALGRGDLPDVLRDEPVT